MPIELVTDERGGVTVVRDGHPQSYVQPDDPQLLVFEYVQHLALALDALAPAGRLGVTHIGGAGLTLARYVEHTRPGSPQIVLEPDVELTEVVRRELPLPRGHRIRVRPVDGAAGVGGLKDASADVVVLDAYDEGRVPADLTSATFAASAARVLRPGGLLLMNLADEPGLRYVARVVATLLPAFPSVAAVTLQEVLKGKRYGNVVLVASAAPLDVDELRRRAARADFPTGVLGAAELTRRARSATPFDEVGEPSPAPPDPGRWRLR
ncbi:spermidine synthase [Luteipulveratus flavus]|uniref:spermidine synthase n=1 Tax=Luteipulveratus flavus TaxID=3031728 RepID=UPI003211F04A